MKFKFFSTTNEIAEKFKNNLKIKFIWFVYFLDQGIGINFEAPCPLKKVFWKNKIVHQNKLKKKFQRLAPKFLLYKILSEFHELIEEIPNVWQNKS